MTAFVDRVEIIRVLDGSVVSGAVANPSFEAYGPLSSGTYGANPSGASWTFTAPAPYASGITQSGGGFMPPPSPTALRRPACRAAALPTACLLPQTLVLPDSVYQVRFLDAQRPGYGLQALNVLVNGVSVGTVTPPSSIAFTSYTSNTFQVGPPNNALAFDGSDDYVSLGSPASRSNLGVSGCTLETWVNINSTGNMHSLIRKDGAYPLAVLPNGTPYIEVWNQGTGNSARTHMSGTANLTAGRWQHLAGTWNGTTLRLYLDGAEVSGTQASSPITISSQLQLGRSATSSQPLAGRLDEVRIYNTALAQAQVQAG